MKIVHMLADYQILCDHAKTMGKFAAYQEYISRYPAFFEGVFQYLYFSTAEELRPYIENADFDRLLSIGQKNYAAGKFDQIIAATQEISEKMDVSFDFELYLGMEMGNIGGCSVPRKYGVPFVYFGMDRVLDENFIRVFVPHELYHMLRGVSCPEGDKDSLLSRVVEEGLASFTPMWLHDMPWNEATVSDLLGLSVSQAGYLMAHTREILEDVLAHCWQPLTAELMQQYFVFSPEGEDPVLGGYFAGLYLSYLSVQQGFDFKKFLTMSCDQVLDTWQQYYV